METLVKFTKMFCKKKIVFVGVLLLALTGAIDGYSMQFYCNKEFSFISKYEDQIKLDFDDNYIYDTSSYDYGFGKRIICETTFEAWYSTYPKFMFYFENLDLDCNDGHLEFYAGQNSDTRVPGLERDICGGNKPEDVYTVDKRYFRIKYVPKKSQYLSDIFTIVITTFTDGVCPGYAYECDNSRCIDEDLTCNGYNSCGDGSDCNLTTGVIIGIVVGSIAGLAVIVSIVICCICCMRRSRNTPGSVQSQPMPAVVYTAQSQNRYSQPMYGVNSGSPYNTSSAPYPVAISTSLNTTSDQQRYSQPTYGVSQGSQYPTNQAPYQTVSSNQQNDIHQSNGPPPQYSEIGEYSSNQGTNQS